MVAAGVKQPRILLLHFAVTSQEVSQRGNEKHRASTNPRLTLLRPTLTLARSWDLCCPPTQHKIVSYPDWNLKEVIIYQGRLN